MIAAFHRIEGSVAIVRSGIYVRQSELYARGDRLFLKTGSGFLRVLCKFGDAYGTACPKTKVLEYEADGVVEEGGELRYRND